VSDQLGAVLPEALLVTVTVSGELVGDVAAELVPDASGARRGEGPQLERRAAQRQDDGGDGEGEASARRGLLVIAAVATFTGFLTGFFGVGGGFIVVPMLVLALGFPMKEASGTSLLVMIIASSAGLAARVGTHSNVDWLVVLAFAAASMVGGFLGGPLTKRASASTLTTAFGLLLLGVCVATTYDLLAA